MGYRVGVCLDIQRVDGSPGVMKSAVHLLVVLLHILLGLFHPRTDANMVLAVDHLTPLQ